MIVPSGYLLINKPVGISSFFAVRKLQYRLRDITGGQKVKVGHSGTLDPLAEGLLLCGIQKGTKVLEELLLADKKYTAEIFLGEFSTTDDSEGEKSSHQTPRKDIPTQEEVEKVIEHFIGNISQVPPQYSALKIQGKRACDRIRESQNSEKKIDLKARNIDIFDIKILSYHFPILEISVHCGSGTYIRSLARDIGQKLNTGGYITTLRRDTIGDFLLSNAKNIEAVELSDIQNFTSDMFDMPKYTVDKSTAKRLQTGQRVVFFRDRKYPKNPQKGTIFLGKTFLGFGEQDQHLLRPRKML